ncbi:putative amino acid transporter [Aspergillus saccharolyticus JOP 1030-1]|uniref:Amino acid transporter transmembrane domain-containing protein n=1 Tax=Aspergillus saccharolyticus JOP 1030-1 TaxID=1450539 RepID=A0A318ZB61_9EURO|nr:hypothetical protein BP01DRAFT_426875 [Aspergillus saccharolyticus JOP 1030-1]PYH40690.1 hypothetical protein BP01DRAFT_426875 [Aspergillus saccharolyticus JOP 1030-1]
MAGIISAANLGGIADPRLGNEADLIGTEAEHGVVIEDHTGHPQHGKHRSLHTISAPVMHGKDTIYLDKSISFENYLFWAKRSREVEKHIRTDNQGLQQWWNLMLGRGTRNTTPAPQIVDSTVQEKSPVADGAMAAAGDEKVRPEKEDSNTAGDQHGHDGGRVDQYGILETEWEQAQRAARTATWGSIFYLITTDILGPTNVPWAISQMGYGPGFALYTVFGIMAYYSGMQLWKIFNGLDSARYPMRNYGDVAFRIFGSWARIFVNVLQSFQFFLNVTLLIVSNGQGLAQMVAGEDGTGYLCFIVCELIFMLCGFVLGQIRTLQRLSWLSNLAIWMNFTVILITAAIKASSGLTIGPVVTSANWPAHGTLYSRMTAVMNCVFAYGGATLFNELMAEMRRPFDFWKGFICAEVFIYVCYLVEGMVVYNAQGQFTYNPAYQGIPDSAYRYQTAGNALSLITGVIAALLYGNIGIKVFYASVLRDVFHLPPLDHRTGKLIWIGLVPVYWCLAWVVAAAIPQISNLTSFVGALCILQFSYTFPPMLLVGFNVQKDAILPEETFDPHTGETRRVDGGWQRWMRGYRQKFARNTFDVLYSLAALGTAGLGLWASIKAMEADFASTPLTPFTCTNPAS